MTGTWPPLVRVALERKQKAVVQNYQNNPLHHLKNTDLASPVTAHLEANKAIYPDSEDKKNTRPKNRIENSARTK